MNFKGGRESAQNLLDKGEEAVEGLEVQTEVNLGVNYLWEHFWDDSDQASVRRRGGGEQERHTRKGYDDAHTQHEVAASVRE